LKFRKKQRFVLLVVAMSLIAVATALVLTALQDNIALFATPSEIAQGEVEAGRQFRVGGLVTAGSVSQHDDGAVSFALNDGANEITVTYAGLLPDLFREEQGIVAMGTLLPDGRFEASEVLAKHDETYIPKEVADALKASGQWRDEDAEGGS
jgi:cytochrome c-type biogenesis protein CcmE